MPEDDNGDEAVVVPETPCPLNETALTTFMDVVSRLARNDPWDTELYRSGLQILDSLVADEPKCARLKYHIYIHLNVFHTIPKWVFTKAMSKFSNIFSFSGTTLPRVNLFIQVVAFGKEDGRLSLNVREGGVA